MKNDINNAGFLTPEEEDNLYWQACEYVIRTGRVSISHLQIKFRIGYMRAGRWIERMEENGVIPVPKDRLH